MWVSSQEITSWFSRGSIKLGHSACACSLLLHVSPPAPFLCVCLFLPPSLSFSFSLSFLLLTLALIFSCGALDLLTVILHLASINYWLKTWSLAHFHTSGQCLIQEREPPSTHRAGVYKLVIYHFYMERTIKITVCFSKLAREPPHLWTSGRTMTTGTMHLDVFQGPSDLKMKSHNKGQDREKQSW